ncbi:MAG: ATP synthase F1 subunit epsilon [bacterium]
MFHFQLVSLTGTIFDGEVHEVILPTLEGEIGVLQDHMPLVSVATSGMIAVRKNAKDNDANRDYYAASGGVIDVVGNSLKVLVDEADHSEGIDESQAQKAYDLAVKMKAEAKDQVSLDHAQQMVDRSSVRLQVAGLKRRRHRP